MKRKKQKENGGAVEVIDIDNETAGTGEETNVSGGVDGGKSPEILSVNGSESEVNSIIVPITVEGTDEQQATSTFASQPVPEDKEDPLGMVGEPD